MSVEPANTLGAEEQVRLAGPDYNLRGRGVCPLQIRARLTQRAGPPADLGQARRTPGGPGVGRGWGDSGRGGAEPERGRGQSQSGARGGQARGRGQGQGGAWGGRGPCRGRGQSVARGGAGRARGRGGRGAVTCVHRPARRARLEPRSLPEPRAANSRGDCAARGPASR